MHCLIDADILTYRIGFAVQSTVGDELIIEPVHHAYYLINRQVEKILENCNSRSCQLYLTSNDKSNYRFDMAKTLPYKANRLQAKPFYYHELRDYMIKKHNAAVVSGMEADDALGIAQYNSDEPTIICSIDKDLLMIPGLHYNIATGEIAKYADPGELYPHKNKILGGGVKWFYAQMLMGDTADNIPGCPGIGPKKALKLLNNLDDEANMYKTVMKVYTEKKIQDRFEEVANLLWIQRITDQLYTDREEYHAYR